MSKAKDKNDELDLSTDQPGSTEDSPLIVVGIGASAGGLEALTSIVKTLKPATNICYVIAQHLSPTYKSMMVDLLAKDSEIEIQEAKNNGRLVENIIYICPPNNNISITHDDRIHLSQPEATRYGPKPSIDLLFESIATVKRSRGIGIILSGTGSDGARGIRFIKSEAGFTFVQDPITAKYDGMPNAAIGTSKVDFILPADKIADELRDILIYPHRPKQKDSDDRDQAIYRLIYGKVKEVTKVDFSKYKSSTLHRRIDRRMATLKLATLKDYNNYLQKTPGEAEALYKNILIGVTGFFRDTKAFELIREQISDRLANKSEKIVRVWAPGSSTGEEAYTIAIILQEILREEITDWRIQIFATDIDEDALALARSGAYPESALIPLTKEQRDQYFRLSGDEYTVTKTIRDMVIFSRHDIAVDPPFLNLDLIVCRNLLIYFDTELQQRILPAFHYALGEEGLLLLGKSESIGQFANYFATLDSRWRVYKANYLGDRKRTRKEANTFDGRPYAVAYQPRSELLKKSPETLRELFIAKVQQYILPMCVLINEAQDIIYSGGKNPYISRPSGASNDNLIKNVHPALATELRVTYQKAQQDQKVIKSPYIKVELFTDVQRYVRVIVVPMEVSSEVEKPCSLVCFQEESANEPLLSVGSKFEDSDKDVVVKQLESELLRTQNQLQTLVEELETSNEELQSMNEELQSANEELQSTNEELETTNEELQSTNEELQTAYSELRMSYSEQEQHASNLTETQSELENINAQFSEAQRVAKIGHFDWDLNNDRISWSPYLYKIFDFNPEIVQPTMDNILVRVHPDDRAMLEKAVEEAMQRQTFGLDYRLRMDDGSIKHVRGLGQIFEKTESKPRRMTGTLQDITAQVSAEKVSVERAKNVDLLMELAPVGIYLFDIQSGKNTYINEAFTEITGHTLEDINAMSQEEFMGLFKAEELDTILKHMDKVAHSQVGKIHSIDYHFRHKSGEWLSLRSSDAIFKVDAANKGEQMMGSFVVISSED